MLCIQVDTNNSGLIEWKEFLALVSRMDAVVSDALAPDDPNEPQLQTDFDFVTETVEVSKSFQRANFFLGSQSATEAEAEAEASATPKSNRQSRKEALAKNPMQVAAENVQAAREKEQESQEKEKNVRDSFQALIDLESCLRIDHVWASDDCTATRIPWEDVSD